MNNIEEFIKKVVSWVGWLLLFSALAFYGYGIYNAIQQTLAGVSADDYPEFLSTTIGSIQALLLTNLGFVLGISVANPASRMALAVGLNRPGIAQAGMAPPAPLDLKSQVQLFAIIVYLLSLIACLIAWIIRGFPIDTTVVPLVAESAKMFVGVVLAYLSVVLSK